MFLEVIHPGCDLFCGRTNSGYPQPPQQTCADNKTRGSANGNWVLPTPSPFRSLQQES